MCCKMQYEQWLNPQHLHVFQKYFAHASDQIYKALLLSQQVKLVIFKTR